MQPLTLVTGSAGHLGEAMVRTLRALGAPVRGLDRIASPFTDVVGSIVDPEVVDTAMAGVTQVVHAATLHKPHVATHTRQAFIDTNLTGTLNLLEAAVRARVRAFVFTSTTSTFGDALVPPADAPAAWITEAVSPVPKNIYGVTKVAAEDLCALAHRNQQLAVVVLRTSRFFPDADDDPAARDAYPDANLKANELLNRRVDIEDVVTAHQLALERAPAIGFARYIISATTPLARGDTEALRRDAAGVLRRHVPGIDATYAALGWRLPPSIDRVYDNARARGELGWQPRHDFASVIARVAAGGSLASELARSIGVKDYHPR
ncbi:MAG: NAD(P)-dependent oxidoreductase [Kofleriaceae bacterium]